MKEVSVSVNYLKNFLNDVRWCDKQEILSLDGDGFEKELFSVCFDNSFETYFLSTDDEKPLALGGAYSKKHDNTAKVWLLCTNKLISNKKDVYKYVKNKIRIFQSKYDFLYNFIYKTNFNSLNWLKACGFKVLDLKNPDFKMFYFCKGEYKFDLRYFTCE